MARDVEWPEWWSWELDCSNPHLTKRMIDRSFSETDFREMLQHATNYLPDDLPRRWVINTQHGQQQWEVIVEPDPAEKLLVVVTAFRVG